MRKTSANPILSVRDLRVTFPHSGKRVAVVDGVSFDLQPGEILGLVGESGCGKSVTGAALMGMVPSPAGQVSAGKMQLGSKNLMELSEAQWRKVRGGKIAMVFQEPLTALDPVFTIGNQICEVIKRHQNCKQAAASATARALLESMGLPDSERLMKSYPHELSGGMRQRVMIAMAMSCQPSVLIADEPTTALDTTTQAQILQQFHKLAGDSGTAIVFITHDLGVAAQVCDRVEIMYCGQVAEEGPPRALFSNARHPYSAGLLAAVPQITSGPVRPVRAIPGTVPHLSQIPPGCRFNNRCELAQTQCRQKMPELRNVNDAQNSSEIAPPPNQNTHRYACHHPLNTTTV